MRQPDTFGGDPGYYVIRFQSHHFVRFWCSRCWHFAEGAPPTPLATNDREHMTIERIVQP